jgi:hypothetical protein
MIDSNLDLVQEQLKEKIGKFLLSIQIDRTVDFPAFQEVDAQAKLLARLLKSQEYVSKSVLNELHMTTKVLRAEASHIKGEEKSLIKMAEQLGMTFDLILLGECQEDRIPGVPRII